MIKNIEYKDYSKKNDIHGTVTYPATMIAPVQKKLLDELMNSYEVDSIFDPFFGSGTSLYEAMLIDENVRLAGCDINPFAYLITETKLNGIDFKYIKSDIRNLEKNSKKNYTNEFSFPNIEKWFRPDIADSLRKIRLAIMETNNERNRKFFWCIFSNIVRRFSNTRSSTFKLHSRTQEDISRINNNVINLFLESIKRDYKYYNNQGKYVDIYKDDILLKATDFHDGEFDISITSPPYGDNQTTVTYGQFSSLPLKWIDKKDLQLEGWELDNYSIIDRKSMGGSAKKITLNTEQLNLLTPYLFEIRENKHRKILLFFNDYFKFLDEICRITNQFIVMTLGNRRVDNVPINLTKVTMNYLELNGFRGIFKTSRSIRNKRIPVKTSRVNNQSVRSMNTEFVIVHERI